MEIQNKVAIITGGIGGIGFTTVQYFLKNGAEYVAIFDILQPDSTVVIDKLKNLEEEFKKVKFGYYVVDIRNVEKFKAGYEKVMEQKKYVDILVNNAGVANDLDIDLTIDVNLRAVIHGTMIAIDNMGKHKNHKGGVVVNIASFLGLVNNPSYPVYNATKHGVVSFVRSMKEHNEVLGVRIVAICPGMTQTNMVEMDNLQKGMLTFVHPKYIVEAIKIYSAQEPDNVASAIVEIIKRGKSGDVWLAQCSEPPFNTGEIDDLEKMRIPF